LPDYASWLASDPIYTRGLAPLLEQRQNAIVGFGDATGIPGVDPNVAGLASGNQYSTLAQLRHLLAQNQSGIQNASNSQGLLFSGAHAQQQQNAVHAEQGQEQDARAQLLAMLTGSKQDEASLYNDAYSRFLANPPGVGSDPAAAAAAPAAPVAPAVPYPVAPGAAPVTALGSGSTAGADVIKPLMPRQPRPPTVPKYSTWMGGR
jgi:hypothetical protein